MNNVVLERLAKNKIRILRNLTSKMSKDELEFLIADIDILINLFTPSKDVEQNYEYYTQVKKLIRK